MNLYLTSVLSLSSMAIPLVTAIIKRNWLKDKYLPLMLLVIAGSITEIMHLIYDFWKGNSNIYGNIYVLLELLLILRLYEGFGITFSKKLIRVFSYIGVVVWILDNFVLHSLECSNSLFRMVSSLMIVFVSIDKLHMLLLFNGKPEIKDPELILTIGFLLYFVYKTFVEAYHLFPVPDQRPFYRTLWMILNLVNIITNFIIGIAILCIRPKTQHYMAS